MSRRAPPARRRSRLPARRAPASARALEAENEHDAELVVSPEADSRVDWLVVGLGNPGTEYAGTRHNIGFEIAHLLAARWGLPRTKARYRGLLTEGRTEPGGPRVAVLLPQTYMNEAGTSVGPARGALKLPLERVLVLHDEIDLPFGEIRVRTGGGLAGHNGLKSLRDGLGSPDFARVRVGVGRPPTTDPDRVAAYVLGRFREPGDDVALLVERAADVAERVVLGEAQPT